MSDDTYLGIIWCCSFCRLRMSECGCTDETPWASNRVATPVDRAEYGRGWSVWGQPRA